ncbi:MAG: hypothetical protein KKA90_00770 [Nanoarchaeota archaeon]|nr:hypothetical protein [Nanoarchaeota archaeon]
MRKRNPVSENELTQVKRRILETFGEVANSIGYSPLHGQVIGVLLIKGEPVSLQKLASETGYSTSTLSLSLDLLEVLGVIKKIKKTGDRRLYIQLHGDLLGALKKAIMLRLEKSITSSLNEFKDCKERIARLSGEEKEKLVHSIDILEGHIKRLESYVDILSKMELP